MCTSLAVQLSVNDRCSAVVELYSEWCGSCKSVQPTFKRLRTDKDDEACLRFLMVQAEGCNLLDEAVQHRGRSEPAFLLFRVRLPLHV